MGFLDRLVARERSGGATARSSFTRVPRRRLGFSSFSPSELFSGAGEPAPESIFQAVLGGAGNVISAGREFQAETAQGLLEPLVDSTLGLAENLGQTGTALPGLIERPTGSPQVDFLSQALGVEEPATASANQDETELTQMAQAGQETLRRLEKQDRHLAELLKTPQLSREAQQNAAIIREEIGEQIDLQSSALDDIARVRGFKRDIEEVQEGIVNQIIICVDGQDYIRD